MREINWPVVESRDYLLKVIKDRCVRRGDFKLASGATSDTYVDLRNLTLSQWSYAIAAHLFRLVYDSGRRCHHLGGPESGANQIVGAVLCYVESVMKHDPAADLWWVEGFVVRKAEKDHGVGGMVVGKPPRPGSPVCLVDDVMTSGKSLLRAADEVEKLGANVVLAVSILDRGAGAAEALAARGIEYRPLFRLSELGLENKG